MPTSLTAAASSEYIKASNALRQRSALPQVFVYVEGIDDIIFWNACLLPYADRFNFNITQFKNADGKISEGKSHLLNSIGIDTLGPYKLVAIDSDYDWIIDNYKTSPSCISISNIIRENKYILHTYLYSIENYKCHPDCIQKFVVALSNKIPSQNVKDLVKIFSISLADLFLIHLVSADLCDNVYPIKAFRSDASQINIDVCNAIVTEISKERISSRLTELNDYALMHKDKIEEYRSKLESEGFSPDTFHFLFQGHILAGLVKGDTIANIILRLRKERIAEILSEGSESQQKQRLSQFSSVTGINSTYFEDGSIKPISNSEHIKAIHNMLNQLFFHCSDVMKADIGYNRIKQDLSHLFENSCQNPKK